MLAALVLAGNNDAGGDMGKTNCRGGLVDVLTAVPTVAFCWALSALPCVTAWIEKLLQ